MSPLDETDMAFTLMVFPLEAGYYKLFNGDLERGKEIYISKSYYRSYSAVGFRKEMCRLVLR